MSELGIYYSLVLGSSSNSFINLFQKKWKEHLKSFPRKYQKGKQLVIGARFRPLLVSWGYLLSGENFDARNRAEVVNLAVYIELLHKATLLIDDLIDEDDARHGEESFHVEFSDPETILFAIYLLGDCLERLSVSMEKLHFEKWYHEIIELLSRAIKDMSYGAIEEIGLAHDQLASVPKVKEIIELQTIALVKNGLLVGYKYGRGSSDHDAIIDSLGYDCGYLFQVLNDLEPFLDRGLNAKHKGSTNLDIVRSRKNIAVAFIFERLSSLEREKFHQLRKSTVSQLASSLNEWFLRYNILDSMLENLVRVKKNIDRNIDSLPVEFQRRKDFSSFIDYVLSTALKRIGSTYCRKLSEILIK